MISYGFFGVGYSLHFKPTDVNIHGREERIEENCLDKLSRVDVISSIRRQDGRFL